MTSPIEVTTRYATTVDDLPAAWAFVMSHLDSLGDDPSIEINPLWNIGFDDSGDAQSPRQFSVVVSGMVEAASS